MVIVLLVQAKGSTKSHPFTAFNVDGDEVIVLTNPICKYRINGGTKITFTPTISAYDTDFYKFYITVPEALAINEYDSLEIYINSADGKSYIYITIVPNVETLIWKLRHKSKFI